jgi:hypothetical protein
MQESYFKKIGLKSEFNLLYFLAKKRKFKIILLKACTLEVF